MRILAVGTRPGEAELLAGATLARFAEEGHQVFIAHLTRGDKEGVGPPDALAAARREEAEASARTIGAVVLPAIGGDLELNDGDERQRGQVADLIRKARPDLILTYGPESGHPDQRIANRLLFHAAYASALPNAVSLRGLAPHAVRAPIFHWDTADGAGFYPHEFVDITGAMEKKRAMLEAHRSLCRWHEAQTGFSLIEEMEALAAWRGGQCKVDYAEGFRRESAQGRNGPVRLLPGAPLEAGQDPGTLLDGSVRKENRQS